VPYTTAGDVKFRARRSCLSVPASSPKMLGKAPGLAADEIFMDLEDSVAPGEKEAARKNVIAALNDEDFGNKTVVLRINGVYTHWCYRDILEIVEAAGQHLDCIMIPKVQWASDVTFVSDLLRMIEETNGFTNRIGLEAQIENAQGLTNINEIAAASDRLETLIFGPGDMAAAMGMPHSTVGQKVDEYPGDHWHWILMTILVAARNRNLQAIDGPYAAIRDLDGFREVCRRSRALGYDGKWALNPAQIDVLNEVFTPSQEEYDRAEDILDAYQKATEEDLTGAVMFGDEMIDEASRKMAAVHAAQGRAAGLTRTQT
jgi:citrate lyase subunit beta / citryl-CoA lyase